jgi:two-component system, response regulator PdtaR
MPETSPAPRVLVVEDEIVIALELEAVLHDGGFEVLGPAPSVAAALTILKSDRPDCAVLDVSLRGELVTPVAELLVILGVPFLLASAYRRSDFHLAAVLMGALNLGKPTDAKRLIDTINTLIGA